MKLFRYALLSLVAAGSIDAAVEYRSIHQEMYSAVSPLECGSWSVELRGGFAPTIFTGCKGSTDANASTGFFSSVCPSGQFVKLDKFSEQFKEAFIVGGVFEYAWTDCTSLFADLNYRHAKTRICCEDYKAFSGYVGARYYFDPICDVASIFVGGKIGASHHFNDCHKTVISGGGQVGLDWYLCHGLSLVVTVEAVASGSVNMPSSVVFTATSVNTPATPATTAVCLNRAESRSGAQVIFPITIGLKYNF